MMRGYSFRSSAAVRTAAFLFAFAGVLVVSGAAQVGVVSLDSGVASYYGPGFHGRQTSSGEVFDMYAMTAAHRTLPFGTMVRVCNADNGREVVVRVNDRGPFVKGRVIDLSYAAARALGMVEAGTAHVAVYAAATTPTTATETPTAAATTPTAAATTTLPGMDLPPGKQGEPVCRVQVASYANSANAQAAFDRLSRSGFSPELERFDRYTRVILPEIPAQFVESTLRRLSDLGYPGAIYTKYVKP